MDDLTDLESLPIEQLIEMIREKTGAGVNLSFPGKVLARQLGRRVRPRTPVSYTHLDVYKRQAWSGPRICGIERESANWQARWSVARRQVCEDRTTVPQGHGG